MMKKLYIEAESKAELNRRIVANEEIIGTEYNLFNPYGYESKWSLKNLTENVIVAIYDETIHDKPCAKTWGTYIVDVNKVV